MTGTRIETSTTPTPGAKPARLTEVAARAEAMATDLAAMAGSATERRIVGAIAASAIRRTFGREALS